MQSLLLISKDQQQRKNYLESFFKEKEIGTFDRQVVAPEDDSFGISLVRNLQKKAYLAPVTSKEKALILEDAQKLTIDAQNALLKILEEPPVNTYIILSATTDNFLPTILSRCKIVLLNKGKKEALSEDSRTQLTDILDLLQKGSIAQKLSLAEKVAGDKQDLGRWLENMILLVREELLKQPDNKDTLQLLRSLSEAYRLFQTTNLSPRVLLEHAFLAL